MKAFLKVGMLTGMAALAVYALVQDQNWREMLSRPPAQPVEMEISPEVRLLVDVPVQKAYKEKKAALIRFNLENCAICERMSREVFTTPEWQAYAVKNLIIDDTLMPAQFTSQNTGLALRMRLLEAIAEATGQTGGFPTVALVGMDGRILGAKSGYQKGGPKDMIHWVERLRAQDVSAPRRLLVPSATEMARTNAAKEAAPTALTNLTQKALADPLSVLALKGISGTAGKRIALINVGGRNILFNVGDRKLVKSPAGDLMVECVQATEESVVIRLNDDPTEHELTMK